LRVKRLVSLRAQHWGVTATPSGTAEITEGLSGPVKDLDVLVVDDITDTGESLALATEAVRKAGAVRVESATFLHIGHAMLRPDYVAEEIPRDQWVWIVFPWNYWEDARNLVARAVEEAKSAAGARALLRERSGLDIPLDRVEEILAASKDRSSGAGGQPSDPAP
ncbi:MAG TPA: phosphoribosyltransferase family protein, partial [Thermoplasmata archaeon]|nr:phosphoribosyltransferase family protein [Thermoplasmata archaeon]